MKANGDAMWSRLKALKAEGLIAKLGLSLQPGEDAVGLAKRFKPDIVQLPVSILDQRYVNDQSIASIHALGIEVEARSVFLQGLLFTAQ